VQTDEAHRLREEWKKKGSPPCKHERTEKEYYLVANTGDKICRKCGKIM
jgi:hypothetical protein